MASKALVSHFEALTAKHDCMDIGISNDSWSSVSVTVQDRRDTSSDRCRS
jgi:hypothetical protein